jgi:hypothetical protein
MQKSKRKEDRKIKVIRVKGMLQGPKDQGKKNE